MKRRGKGSILALVIVSMLVLSTVGMAVIYMFSMETMSVNNKLDSAKVLYLAESGVAMTEAWLINIQRFPEYINHNTLPITPPFSPVTDTTMNGTFNVIVTPIINPQNDVNMLVSTLCASGSYNVKSEGKIDSSGFHVKKTIFMTVHITTKPWNSVDKSSFTYSHSRRNWDEWPVERILY